LREIGFLTHTTGLIEILVSRNLPPNTVSDVQGIPVYHQNNPSMPYWSSFVFTIAKTHYILYPAFHGLIRLSTENPSQDIKDIIEALTQTVEVELFFH
jgi:hypothetical protein